MNQRMLSLTVQFRHLQALGDAVRRQVEILQDRWSEDVTAMPVYPAFR